MPQQEVSIHADADNRAALAGRIAAMTNEAQDWLDEAAKKAETVITDRPAAHPRGRAGDGSSFRMADQETVKTFGRLTGNGTPRGRSSDGQGVSDRSAAARTGDPSSSGVVTNVAGFGEDLLTLVELQARLTAIEVRQNLESARSGGTLIAVGAIVAISGLPVMLMGTPSSWCPRWG